MILRLIDIFRVQVGMLFVVVWFMLGGVAVFCFAFGFGGWCGLPFGMLILCVNVLL